MLKDTVGDVEFHSASSFEGHDCGSDQRHFFRWARRKYCAPFQSPAALFRSVLGFLPILKWLPRYSWRDNFLYDVISGLTTGVMFVPQGIAYSYLAGVDPVYGLYSSFLAPLFYVFLGSSPHVSRGPSSVLGIMSGVSNEQIRRAYSEHLLLSSVNSTTNAFSGAMEVPDSITVAATLTFTIGLLQLCMAVARLEFISDYFSEPLVGGFTSAAAVHVLISQTSVLMGISTPKKYGPGYLVSLLSTLFSKLLEVNLVSFGASLVAIAFLMIGKEFVNPWINKRSSVKIALPYELVLMIIAALLSRTFDWPANYGIKVVGDVPRGLPMPRMPRLDLIPYTLPSALAIAMLTLGMHFSMVKLFANRMHYSVDSGQELYAISLGSVFSGFFPVYPTSTALGRTMVMVESGARSQISSVVSCVLLLAVILWLGPLFRPLPQCILSAVIIVALRPIFRKTSEIFEIWRLSKYDAAIWIMSFTGTVLTDVISGLCISVAFTLLTVVSRTQWPLWSAQFSKQRPLAIRTEKEVDAETAVPDYCVFRFESFLLFTNAERFRKSVQETLHRWNSSQKSKPKSKSIRTFIFDFSTTTQIDSAGLSALSKSVTHIRRSSRVCFVHCKDSMRKSLLEAKIVSSQDQDFFTSIAEAVKSLSASEAASQITSGASAPQTVYSSFRNTQKE
ncbi:sulfate permease family domain-containing protein [Ditylenchus destructor]|nr:sulfate permease family domain-containing protein [Ditylenchus destructor]